MEDSKLSRSFVCENKQEVATKEIKKIDRVGFIICLMNKQRKNLVEKIEDRKAIFKTCFSYIFHSFFH